MNDAPKMLNYKNKHVKSFEMFLLSMRFITFFKEDKYNK